MKSTLRLIVFLTLIPPSILLFLTLLLLWDNFPVSALSLIKYFCWFIFRGVFVMQVLEFKHTWVSLCTDGHAAWWTEFYCFILLYPSMIDKDLYIFNAYNLMSLMMFPSMIPSPHSIKQTYLLPPKFSVCSLLLFL